MYEVLGLILVSNKIKFQCLYIEFFQSINCVFIGYDCFCFNKSRSSRDRVVYDL